MLQYFLRGTARRLGPRILGTHPHNTVLAFNWSNIRQLRTFMRRATARMSCENLIVVDVGAGKLPYFEFLRDRVSRYIAVDHEEILLHTFEDARVERCVGAAESLPVADEQADAVLMNQVLEHVMCPDRSFAEVLRVLKPGGLFIGSVPHLSPVHLEPYDFRRYTDLGVRQILEKHQFDVIEISGNGGVYSSAALMIAMDWMLSKRQDGRPQEFSSTKAFWLSPFVGVMNISAYVLDRLLPRTGRSPANLTWIAKKPIP